MNEQFQDGILIYTETNNGDGTGTRTTYRPDGTVDTVENLTGLPIIEPEPVSEIDELKAQIAALTALIAGDET